VRVLRIRHQEERFTLLLRRLEELLRVLVVQLRIPADAQVVGLDNRIPAEARDRREVRDFREDAVVIPGGASCSPRVGTSARIGLNPSAPLRCGYRPVIGPSGSAGQTATVTCAFLK
jgi:hypothetical protein